MSEFTTNNLVFLNESIFNKKIDWRYRTYTFTFKVQWYSNEVFVWNLQYFSQPGQELADAQGTTFMKLPDEANLEGFSNAPSGSGGGNELSNGWKLRPFHPKVAGLTVIKNAVI